MKDNVTKKLIKFFRTYDNKSSIEQIMRTALRIINVLILDFSYNGTDLYMTSESYNQLCEALYKNRTYSNGNQEKYISYVELRDLFMKELRYKLPSYYSTKSKVGRTPYEVPTEEAYKNTISIMLLLEKFGIKPVTTNGNNVYYSIDVIDIIKGNNEFKIQLKSGKVTDYLLDLWNENSDLVPLQNHKRRTLNIINSLKLDYCYDGLDIYMDTENFEKISLAIKAYCDYIVNRQDYLTATELRSYLKSMPYKVFTNYRKSYDVPTEYESKTIIPAEIELESVGIKPVTVCKGTLIFRKNDVHIAKDNLVTIHEMAKIMKKQYGYPVQPKTLKKFITDEYYETKYNLESFRIKCFTVQFVYKKDILDFIKLIMMDRHMAPKKVEDKNVYYNSNEYYNLSSCSKALGVNVSAIRRCVKLNIIDAESYMNGDLAMHKIPSSEVDRWKQFKTKYTSIKDLLERFKEEFKEKLDKSEITDENIRFHLKKREYFKCNVVHVKDTPFDKTNVCYINNHDLDCIIEKIKEYVDDYNYSKLSREEKVEYSLSFIDDKLKTTKEDIDNLITDKLDNTKGDNLFGWVDCARALGQTLEKELYLHNNEEIRELIIKLTPLMNSKAAKMFLGEFLSYTKVENDCVFDCDFIYEDNDITPVDITPYTMEQMGRFAILIFNETHPDFKERVSKCVEYKSHAGTWLYAALHYVCSWRKKDMIFSLPRITLPTKDYNEYFELFKKGMITDDMAESIARELEDLVSVLNLKPIKTEENTNQYLVLDIPENAKRMIGMLLGLCEAHLQKYEYENPGKTSTYISPTNSFYYFKVIFGDEYIDIFGETLFHNTRANKFYLINIAEIAEENGYGTGYIIASLARAHKFTLDEKSNTTQIYLKYFKNLTDTEILMRELFDRGVCSFMPYLALKMSSGEKIKNLTLIDQTNLIKKLPEPITIEDSLKELAQVVDACKDDINKLIHIFGEKDNVEWKDELKTFVNNLAGKGSNGKTKGTKCILRALGKECNKIYRDNCVGCGEEIYLKSAFYVLGERVRFFTDKMLKTQTKASAVKYKFIIEQVLKPIVKNFRLCLKEIYKVEDMSTFKLVYDGKYIGEEQNAT